MNSSSPPASAGSKGVGHHHLTAYSSSQNLLVCVVQGSAGPTPPNGTRRRNAYCRGLLSTRPWADILSLCHFKRQVKGQGCSSGEECLPNTHEGKTRIGGCFDKQWSSPFPLRLCLPVTSYLAWGGCVLGITQNSQAFPRSLLSQGALFF